MSVKLEVGMYGITRCGERVGPIKASNNLYCPFKFNNLSYQENGSVCKADFRYDIVKVFVEPEIEWGEWVNGPVASGDTKENRQNQWVNGKWQHRFEKPKPPVVQEHFQYTYCFGVGHNIKLTKVGDVTTVEIVK